MRTEQGHDGTERDATGLVVVGGVEVEVRVCRGLVACRIRGELTDAGADVALVIDRGEQLTALQDSGEVTRLRHMRREHGGVFPTGDVTLDSGLPDELEGDLLDESGEHLIVGTLLCEVA
ncbi:MAG: hypothetical protein VYE22_09775 [Myxococcota bacterium]|nr:hypothetical protein [Myxococcota bacterium]